MSWSELDAWERDYIRRTTEVRECDEDPACSGDHGPGDCPWIHGRECWALQVPNDGKPYRTREPIDDGEWRTIRSSYREKGIRFQAEKMAEQGQSVRVLHFVQPVKTPDQFEVLERELVGG